MNTMKKLEVKNKPVECVMEAIHLCAEANGSSERITLVSYPSSHDNIVNIRLDTTRREFATHRHTKGYWAVLFIIDRYVGASIAYTGLDAQGVYIEVINKEKFIATLLN